MGALELEVILDSPRNHVYHPGSTITGLVLLHSPVNEEVRDLSIYFNGYSRVIYSANAESIGRTGLKSSEDELNFFTIKKDLFQGPDFPAKVFRTGLVHQWPFEFTFVESTVQDLTESRVVTREEVFEMKSHSLPPSLHFDQGTISGGIYYELEAKLTRPSGKGASISQRETVLFNQYSDAMASLENVYRYPRGLLGRGGKEQQPVQLIEHRAISFLISLNPPRPTPQVLRSASLPAMAQPPRQRRRSSIFGSFSSTKSPSSPSPISKMRCTVDVSIPKILQLNQLFPINVTVTHDDIENAPPFSIHTARLYLMMLTHWRVPNPSPLRPKAAYIRVTRQSHLLTSRSDLDVAIKLGSITDLGPVLGIKLDDTMPLPFKSYCIARDYSIGIHLVVQSGSDQADFVANLEMPVKLANRIRGSISKEPDVKTESVKVAETQESLI